MTGIVSLQDVRAERERETSAYDAHMNLTGEMHVIIGRAIGEMHDAGATHAHIARVLRFAASEIDTCEPSGGAA